MQRPEEVPWLQRHVEARKLVETVKRLKSIYVYTADEIVTIVGERYRKVKRRRPGLAGRIEHELQRLQTVYQTAASRMKAAASMPSLDELSEFHRRLVEAFVGAEAYQTALAAVRRSLRIMRNIWKDYHVLISSAPTAAEAARLRKEGSGRILSVVRRNARNLELLRSVREELLKTHVISEGLPILVVAGIPSAGKSTLVARISTAEPQVAEYPFTTKSIIVGKVTEVTPPFYIVDTPGILERPRELHNEIERKALAALESLPDVVVFMVDPSPASVQDLEAQMRLLRDVTLNIVAGKNRGLIILINKVDMLDAERIVEAERAVSHAIASVGAEGNLCGDVVKVSALTGSGLQEFKAAVVECLKRYTPWLFV